VPAAALRPDDLSSLALLYFIPQGQAPPGKTDSLSLSNKLTGRLLFPTGQGMQGVNVLGRRWRQYWSTTEDWYTVSSVSGFRYRRTNGNPVTGKDTSVAASMGRVAASDEGYYELTRIPMLPGNWQNVYLETEPINSLYTGQYAVGPYTVGTVEPSGTSSPS